MRRIRLLYDLADDGTWARFEMAGKGIESDGNETTVSGMLTISSVGTAEVDGQTCRWIEFAFDGKRNDQTFTTVDKLLIPEKHFAPGDEPLMHVLKAWKKHSGMAGGAAHEIPDVQNPESRGGKDVRGESLRPFLHGPFETPQKLEKKLVKSKLGELECEGISADEHISAEEHKIGKVSSDSKYVIRLHKDAPFGVVTWEAERIIKEDESLFTTITTKATLSDFGKDAKSAIPEGK